MSELIKVGIAEYFIAYKPNKLITYGLGSCVGIALTDTISGVGGLAHIMLPSSINSQIADNPAKYADSAIDLMVKELVSRGAYKSRMISKIVGGAQMFSFGETNDILKIGKRNISEVKKVLALFNIPILSQDTGGNYGRTVEFEPGTGRLLVKTIGHGIKEI